MSIRSEIGRVSFIFYEVPVEYERLRDERRRLAAQEWVSIVTSIATQQNKHRQPMDKAEKVRPKCTKSLSAHSYNLYYPYILVHINLSWFSIIAVIEMSQFWYVWRISSSLWTTSMVNGVEEAAQVFWCCSGTCQLGSSNTEEIPASKTIPPTLFMDVTWILGWNNFHLFCQYSNPE